VVFSDENVVVANKPAGVSIGTSTAASTAASKAAANAESSGTSIADYDRFPSLIELVGDASQSGKLNPVLHLDRDTSGLVMLAISNSASTHPSSLSSQAKLRSIEQTFVAGIVLNGSVPSRGNAKTRVATNRFGVLVPSKNNSVGWVEASFRILERYQSRALIEFATHDGSRAVRAIAASLDTSPGSAICGDIALGGQPAHRLMLHLRDLTWKHPVSGVSMTTSSPLPWSFTPWLQNRARIDELDPESIALGISDTATLRSQILSSGATNAVRLVHGEADGFGGLDIELYERDLVVWVGEEVLATAIDAVCSALAQHYPGHVHVKRRPKNASRWAGGVSNSSKVDSASCSCGSSDTAGEELVVSEHGLKYFVRPGVGLSTGLFLDQRVNRDWVRQHSAGASVLNLFAYTCSFTVAAAAGGASRTVSVDISRPSLDVGARNMAHNGFDLGCHEFVCDDVGWWVGRAQRKNQQFDLIVFDPPSFGRSRKGSFSCVRDYRDLAVRVVSLLREGGWLLACTNHRGVGLSQLRGWLRSAIEEAGCVVLRWESAPAGSDFPVAIGGDPHMKAFRCRIGRKVG